MNEQQAAYNPHWKRDMRHEKVREFQWRIRMFFLGVFWKVLFTLHIARFVSRMMCRLNIYSKYGLSGRCQWCGVKHGIHWTIEKLNNGGLRKGSL